MEGPSDRRVVKTVKISSDLVVVGGGMAGTCCAITAARAGIKVILVQDRPVLGGNASSEVRLWILGATSHMGNNNRWAREGGVIDEILVENMYRNPEGNTIIFDTILLEKVWENSNITLLLNTAVYEVQKSSADRIEGVTAFCSQNSTRYHLDAPLFCDASGDGVVGFQAGAAFRMGAESSDEFNEPFAPTKEYGELLGHSIYFMSKDIGKPVKYVAPAYALKDITKIPHYRRFNVKEHGCWLWWIEYGGRLDTVYQTEEIKWELWKVVYGVWDYIKNSGNFPEAENLTLEWVGQIPGKRESRRFEGHYIMKQSDIVQQVHFEDAVAHGGWAIDLHPADGVFSEKPSCNQWHSKGLYEIPFRCMVSRNIENLLLAGRIISCSHVAMGSTRVMATCAHAAQAAGMAAAISIQKKMAPKELIKGDLLSELQQRLLATGQHIPHKVFQDEDSLTLKSNGCRIEPSSILKLSEFPFDGVWKQLEFGSAQLLPLKAGEVPSFEISAKAMADTTLTVSLRRSSKLYNFTPDIILETRSFELKAGAQRLDVTFDVTLPGDTYVFICFHQNEEIWIRSTNQRTTGLLSVFNKQSPAVSNYGRQDPDPGLGFESFEFWVPVRRPQGHNFALTIKPPLSCFGVENLTNGFHRPYLQPNAWVADLNDPLPALSFTWSQPQRIGRIVLRFDTDWDHAMESSLLGHSERIVPFVVRDYEIYGENKECVQKVKGNFQSRNTIVFDEPFVTKKLRIEFSHPSKDVPAALYGISIYPTESG